MSDDVSDITVEVQVVKSVIVPGRVSVVFREECIGWVDRSSDGTWIAAIPSERNPGQGVIVDRAARTRTSAIQDICGHFNRDRYGSGTARVAHKGWTF